jgi:hypothetical protein
MNIILEYLGGVTTTRARVAPTGRPVLSRPHLHKAAAAAAAAAYNRGAVPITAQHIGLLRREKGWDPTVTVMYIVCMTVTVQCISEHT